MGFGMGLSVWDRFGMDLAFGMGFGGVGWDLFGVWDGVGIWKGIGMGLEGVWIGLGWVWVLV